MRMDEVERRDLTENQISAKVLDVAISIHKRLGPGLLESVYEAILFKKLKDAGLIVERQVGLPIIFEGMTFEEGYRIDLFINRKVIIEIKSVEEIKKVHAKQVLTYLRLTNCKLGLLINFGDHLMKSGFQRVINGRLD